MKSWREVILSELAHVRARLGLLDGADPAPGRDDGDLSATSVATYLTAAERELLVTRATALWRALDRIVHGSYGQCADCGGPIAPKRLVSLPEAETCIGCQTAWEAQRWA